jgi:DNA-binding response OmpR family regulator
VEAASEGEGRGSRFTVRLPRSAAPPSGEARITAGAPESGRCRILLIEDNEDAREMLQMLLSLAGHDVHGAVDGPSGIEMALATDPDMVVIDLGLPGMDGYEVARQLRSRLRAEVGLIALSGYGQAADRRKSLEAGFDTHLVKPVDPNHLSDVIASIQRRHQDGSKQASS